MNVVVVVSDSMRADHVGAYQRLWRERNPNGGPPVPPYFDVRTPHLDRLAAEGALFSRAHVASYPTIPCRADIFTGRYVNTYRNGTAPLPRDETVLAQVLGGAGYVRQMIVDTPHILRDGHNFDRGFSGWEWIRGQETDRYRTAPAHVTLPCAPEKLRRPDTAVVQYLRNVALRRGEADYFAPRTMGAAVQWLEENGAGGPFFLYVDTFDPHEPWDPPRHYVDLYDPGYAGEEVIYPRYGSTDVLSDAELRHCRALYAAEVTMVDRWVGRLLQAIDDLGLRETTAVFFLADHGFVLGEHGWIGKGNAPLREELTHVPFLVRIPGVAQDGRGGGRVVDAYAQAVDVMPTVLELCGVPDPGTPHGRSLLPLLRGERAAARAVSVSTTALAGSARPAAAAPARATTLIQRPGWALLYGVDAEPQLFDTAADPVQEHNVLDEHQREARELHAAFADFLRDVGAPATVREPVESDPRFRR